MYKSSSYERFNIRHNSDKEDYSMELTSSLITNSAILDIDSYKEDYSIELT